MNTTFLNLGMVIFLFSTPTIHRAIAGTDFDKYREENLAQWTKQIECTTTMSEELEHKKLCKREKCEVEAKVICQIQFPLPPIPFECRGIITP
jgi:hypothetical protein